MVFVSKHAKKRLRQRVHKNWQKAADEAFINGVEHGRLSGGIKRYVDGLALRGWMHQGNISCFKVYYGNVYLFAGDTLVTVMHLPNKFVGLSNRLSSETKY